MLDFEFSRDDTAIALTFAKTGCDYPGDRARTYVVSLPDLQLRPLSPDDKLSVEAHWSPSGETIVYLDYAGTDAGLVAVHVKNGRVRRLTNPG